MKGRLFAYSKKKSKQCVDQNRSTLFVILTSRYEYYYITPITTSSIKRCCLHLNYPKSLGARFQTPQSQVQLLLWDRVGTWPCHFPHYWHLLCPKSTDRPISLILHWGVYSQVGMLLCFKENTNGELESRVLMGPGSIGFGNNQSHNYFFIVQENSFGH